MHTMDYAMFVVSAQDARVARAVLTTWRGMYKALSESGLNAAVDAAVRRRRAEVAPEFADDFDMPLADLLAAFGWDSFETDIGDVVVKGYTPDSRTPASRDVWPAQALAALGCITPYIDGAVLYRAGGTAGDESSQRHHLRTFGRHGADKVVEAQEYGTTLKKIVGGTYPKARAALLSSGG